MAARCVAFLRAINVTHRFVKMEQLAAHVRALGFEPVQTYIQSGNLLLSGSARQAARIEQRLTAELAPLLGFVSEAFVRTETELHAIAQRCVALSSGLPEAGEVNVCFLREPLLEAQREIVDTLASDIDGFVCEGRELYWVCQQRQNSSRFSAAVLERKLKQRTTLRRGRMLAAWSDQLRA